MILSADQNLEDAIVELLLEERLSIKSLHGKLSSTTKISPRAVYKSVKKLIDATVLIKAGQRLMVNEEWKRTVGERLRLTTIPQPSLGERISYTFNTFENLDAFWKTIVLPMEEAASAKEVLFYSAHNFWVSIPARLGSEDAYYRHFNPSQHGFFTVGGESEADREFKRVYQSDFFQIDTRNIPLLRRSDHITLIDSLVITVRLTKNTTKQLDELYTSNKTAGALLPELLEIFSTPGTIRFVIENNPLKAKKLKKLLSRNFYFPQTR